MLPFIACCVLRARATWWYRGRNAGWDWQGPQSRSVWAGTRTLVQSDEKAVELTVILQRGEQGRRKLVLVGHLPCSTFPSELHLEVRVSISSREKGGRGTQRRKVHRHAVGCPKWPRGRVQGARGLGNGLCKARWSRHSSSSLLPCESSCLPSLPLVCGQEELGGPGEDGQQLRFQLQPLPGNDPHSQIFRCCNDGEQKEGFPTGARLQTQSYSHNLTCRFFCWARKKIQTKILWAAF